MRTLEDFIIQQCIYSDILKCKLDQVDACVHVLSALQRDVRPEELPVLSRGLEEMYAAAHNEFAPHRLRSGFCPVVVLSL